MPDAQVATIEAPVSTPAVETTDVLNDTGDDYESSMGTSEGDEAPIDDSEEVEHEGKKYKIPKALKSAVMMHADYTRKTMEVADQRRAVEADREAFAKQTAQQNANVIEYAKLVSIDSQVKQYEQVNWNQLSQTDPAEAQRLWFQFSQLKDARQNMIAHVQGLNQKSDLEAQQTKAKRFEEIKTWANSEIKDWSPAIDTKLGEFAKAEGWSNSEIQSITLSQFKLLYRAYKADELVKNHTPPTPKVEQAKPVPQVNSGNATAKKSPGQMSDKEFALYRQRQIAKRNK